MDVSATWCGPCKLARPVVADLATTHQGALKVVEIDGDESPELVARLGVRGFPTFLGVVGGQIVESPSRLRRQAAARRNGERARQGRRKRGRCLIRARAA
ncbi:MAG: thioredoxin family protein [Polyangiaceae bacterium]